MLKICVYVTNGKKSYHSSMIKYQEVVMGVHCFIVRPPNKNQYKIRPRKHNHKLQAILELFKHHPNHEKQLNQKVIKRVNQYVKWMEV
jgi:hypothetical protein